MNKELRKMNDEQMAMVAGGLIGPFRKVGKHVADAITRQQEETKARLQKEKEEEERWCQEQARLNAQTSVDFDTDGLMPAIIFK